MSLFLLSSFQFQIRLPSILVVSIFIEFPLAPCYFHFSRSISRHAIWRSLGQSLECFRISISKNSELESNFQIFRIRKSLWSKINNLRKWNRHHSNCNRNRSNWDLLIAVPIFPPWSNTSPMMSWKSRTRHRKYKRFNLKNSLYITRHNFMRHHK